MSDQETTIDNENAELRAAVADLTNQLLVAVDGLTAIQSALRIDSGCEPMDLARVARCMVDSLLATHERERALRDLFEEAAEVLGSSTMPQDFLEKLLELKAQRDAHVPPMAPVDLGTPAIGPVWMENR